MADLTEQISNLLENYTDEINEQVGILADEIADELKKDVVQNSPVRSGAYKKSWAIKKEKKLGQVTVTLYNRKHYRLTHLLEKGHALRGGGRTRAIPHILPAEQRAVESFEKGVEEIIENAK